MYVGGRAQKVSPLWGGGERGVLEVFRVIGGGGGWRVMKLINTICFLILFSQIIFCIHFTQ